jgi:hypothetical protein
VANTKAGGSAEGQDRDVLDRAERLAGQLPGVTRERYYGGEALKVGGKAFANECSEPGALCVHCPAELRGALIAARPDFYFVTPHFAKGPYVLVRMGAIDDETLVERLVEAWMARAPARVVRDWNARL